MMNNANELLLELKDTCPVNTTNTADKKEDRAAKRYQRAKTRALNKVARKERRANRKIARVEARYEKQLQRTLEKFAS